MFIGAVIFLILIVMGGIIAFLGDRIGSKVGKKRMTLFGLRPKYTSVIVTVISGVLISFSTIAVMAVVNENVRVALFGLSRLQAQMEDLNQEIKVKNRELEKGKKQLEARNKEYKEVTQKSEETSKELDRVESQRVYMESELSSVQDAYNEAQEGIEKSAAEIRELEKTKEDLGNNINTLNEEKKTLLRNVYALREGQMVMQAGQVLTSVTVDENMTEDRTAEVLGSVLDDINHMLKQQMNITDDKISLIRISQADFTDAVHQIAGAKNKKLVRVVAAQNLIRGERLIVDFDIHDNRLIFSKGETVYQGNLDNYQNIKNYELQVLRFLKDLNRYAQGKGVLPDPITGNVGVLEGQELIDVIQKVKELGGQCELTVTAKRDTYSQGPLAIDVRVDRKDGKQ